jgi:hypothetical protein
MNDFLGEQLQRHAAAMTVPPGDVDAVMARGRRRRWHQRALAGASSATAAGVLAATVIIATHHAPTRTQIASTGPAEPRPTATTLTWHVVDPTSALGATTALTSSAPLYALSTAPGVADPNPVARVIYRSADGLDWSQTSGPSGLYVSDLAANGSQLYAVGTGVAAAAVGGANLPGIGAAWTSDGGHTWHTAQLPMDTAAISSGTTGDAAEALSVASGAKGTVVVAALGAQLDLPRFLPPGVTAPNGWAVTAAGVDLLARSTATCPAGTAVPSGAPSPSGQVDVVPCMPPGGPAAMLKRLGSATVKGIPPATVKEIPPATPSPLPQGTPSGVSRVGPSGVTQVGPDANTPVTPEAAYGVSRSYTWTQLGVSADVERAVLGAPFAYYSADGTTFTAVTLPAPAEAAGPITVVADGDGFTLAASGASGPAYVLRSTDGRTWSTVGAPPGNSFTAAVGDLAGQVAMVSQDSTGIVLSTLGADGQWTNSQLDPSVLGGPGSIGLDGAAFGPLGVVVLASSSSGSATTSTVAFSSDGTHWSAQPVGQLVNTAATTFNPIVTATNVIVSVTLQTNSPAQVPQTVALVGSPS